MLSPGQKAVINTAVRVETVDTLPYRAWDEDAIDFRNIRMDRLLAVIAKWYNVRIADPLQAAQKEHLTGSLRRSSSLEDILFALSETSGVELALGEGGTITVAKDL